ncbi:hypothetical protein [Bacillus sp. AFS017336]|uniref:hypothetical protein n=1 Tax=Bacillus sp. AFS017336 TaxID=2033489 RepID=UPI000BF0E4D2|nr:hypothetical protein [Bacillus sp. AFS017336]PEL14302.1 hypothetical protein CN601_01810 [Bacillus sp. AFS017336]
MSNFTKDLKNLFAESFIDNFDTTDSQNYLIKKFTREDILKPSFYPTNNDFRQHNINEFKYRLDTLRGDNFIDLWERVIRNRTTEHTSLPEVTVQIKTRLISIVKSELYIRKNILLDSVENWGKYAISKDENWGEYAEHTIKEKAKKYKRLLDFLKLLEPVEVTKQAVEFTNDVKEKVKEDRVTLDSTKVRDVEESIEQAKKSLKEDDNFSERFPSHLEAALVSAGLTGLLALLKSLFGF